MFMRRLNGAASTYAANEAISIQSIRKAIGFTGSG
jgi:hypothetical protein